MTWQVLFYNVRLEQELLRLPAGFLARFLRYAERMEIYGPDLECRTLEQWATDCSNSVSRPEKASAAFFIVRQQVSAS